MLGVNARYWVVLVATDVAVSVITGGNVVATMVASLGVALGATWGRER